MDLRALERELGVEARWPQSGGSELSRSQFMSRVAAATAAAATEEQRHRAQAMLSVYTAVQDIESEVRELVHVFTILSHLVL